ncbi:VOC family protein [Bradyrhizobium sp. WSM 1738]|nr:VOC family protein [Bradyrhizobium hereditatis]
MGLGGLQHYTIEPADLERSKDFYCDVLGLENGDRPPLDFPGYWLYSGGTATVHLMGTRKPREGIVVRGTERKYEDTAGWTTSPLRRPTSRVCASVCGPRASNSARASCRVPATRSSFSTIPTALASN